MHTVYVYIFDRFFFFFLIKGTTNINARQNAHFSGIPTQTLIDGQRVSVLAFRSRRKYILFIIIITFFSPLTLVTFGPFI